MDLSRLPFLSIHFFLYPFSKSTRRLFFISLFGLLLLAVFSWFAYNHPDHWALPIDEISDTEAVELPITTFESHYIDFPLSLEVYKQKIGFAGSFLGPHPIPIRLFVLAQLMGWALLLAAASGIKSRWSFLFYLLFALFLFQFDQTSYLSPSWGQWISLAIILAVMGLAYSFQINAIRLNLSWRFICFLIPLGILMLASYQEGGWQAWFHGTVQSFYLLLPISLLWLLFIAREPVNILILAATNWKDPRQRWAYPWILTAIILYLLTAFLLFQELMNWDVLPVRSFIRPIHLLLISGLFTVFGAQNLFRQAKTVFSTNEAFTFILMAFSMISLSFLGLHYSMGDRIFTLATDRWMAIAFFGIGIGKLLFLLLNFIPLLKRKVHLYYLTGGGVIIGYVAVFLVGMLVLLIAEGSDHWKSIRMYTHSQVVLIADESRLAGKSEQALEQYRLAERFIPSSPKALYNQGNLLALSTDTYGEAVEAYQTATRVFEFPFARINAALMLKFGNQAKDGQKILKAGMDAGSTNSYLANSLALAFWEEGEIDSAITYFKQGLLMNTEAAALYSNLALLYEENEFEEAARNFFNASLNAREQHLGSYINALYWNLSTDTSIDIAIDTSKLDNYFLKSNYVVARLNKGDLKADDPQLRSLSAPETATEAILLDGFLAFQQDSLEYGKSRIDYVIGTNPAKASKGHYLLGLAYLKKGVPEMARKHFYLMGDAGNPTGYVHAAQLESLSGLQDSAFVHLTQLRGKYDTLWQDCAKELALLFNAYGQPVYAQTEWDASTFSRNERIRISLYADSTNQYLWALENFRSLIAEDSSDIVPYLEMGNIYRKYENPLALTTYGYGLDIAPDNPQLRMEMALALAQLGKWEEVFSQLSEGDSINLPLPYSKLKARFALAQKDTSAALLRLEHMHQQYPLDQEINLALVQLYFAQDSTIAVEQLLSEALTYNDQYPAYWGYYARLMEAWGLKEEEAFAREQLRVLLDNR